MPEFTVVRVVDGDTFDVDPQWRWNGQTGSRVRPGGYNAPEAGSLAGGMATMKLSRLILGKKVQLGAAHRLDRGRLVCDVYLHGTNLATHFPEYT